MANIWNLFDSLLPKTSLIVAQVTLIHGDGSSTVTDAAGNIFRVIGNTVTVGNKAFIQDGKIIGEAPSLTVYTVEV